MRDIEKQFRDRNLRGISDAKAVRIKDRDCPEARPRERPLSPKSGIDRGRQRLRQCRVDDARPAQAERGDDAAGGIDHGRDTRVSRARDRKEYLARPDLGRMLDPASQQLLAGRDGGPCRLAIVVSDGLSPSAVNAHAVELVRGLTTRLAGDGIEIDHAVVASAARVALGDEIGAILGARMIVMLIGERPGLSAPDSLGAYLTFAPRIGLTDAERNCVSNIHGAGLGYDEAAVRVAWLVREGFARGLSGVALKDESGAPASRHITSN